MAWTWPWSWRSQRWCSGAAGGSRGNLENRRSDPGVRRRHERSQSQLETRFRPLGQRRLRGARHLSCFTTNCCPLTRLAGESGHNAHVKRLGDTSAVIEFASNGANFEVAARPRTGRSRPGRSTNGSSIPIVGCSRSLPQHHALDPTVNARAHRRREGVRVTVSSPNATPRWKGTPLPITGASASKPVDRPGGGAM